VFCFAEGFEGGGSLGRFDAEGFVEAVGGGRENEGEEEDGAVSFSVPAFRFFLES